MMKFLNYLKVEILSAVKQAPSLLLVIVVMPFALSYFLSFTAGMAFNVKAEPPKHSIYVENPKRTERSEQLMTLIHQLADADVFLLSDDVTESDYRVVISERFDQQIENGEKQAVKIAFNKGNSIAEAAAIKIYLEQIVAIIAETNQLQSIINENSDNKAVVEQIIHEAQLTAQNIQYSVEEIDSRNALTGAQYFSVISIGYVFMTVLTSTAVGAVKPELGGLRKRIALLPLSSTQRTLFQFCSSTIIYAVLSFVYIALWKIVNSETFNGNLWILMGWVTLLTMFVNAIGGLVSAWITERWAPVFINGISLGWLAFSGVIPLNRIGHNPIFDFLNKNWVYQIFSEPFMTIIKGELFARYTGLLLSIIIVILICLVSQIMVQKRREV
ncbi:ABC transporter permease [Aerococcaceae bacterium zg-ZUI334]|uniref:ABC transporter permease n=1 Tax=Aerococcaceae bacterium zg-252 TaxID=2796928 RepID=UPI001B9B4F48|nr:ABC transporter permease [Aerococcaceae bacterium zg-ZUI334]